MADSYPATLDGQTAKFADALAQGDKALIALGEAYNCIVDNKLAQHAGYKSALAYLESKFPDFASSKSAVMRASAALRNFSSDDVARYRPNKLGMLLAYANKVDAHHGMLDPNTITVDVPVKDPQTNQEHFVTKPFADCSEAELTAAIKAKKHKPDTGTVPPWAAELYQKYHDKLVAEVGEQVSFKLTVGKDGVPRVTLQAVPMKIMGEVIRALAEVDPAPSLKVVGS